MAINKTGPSQFDDRVQRAVADLSPAEQKVARFFMDRKQAALLGSAAEIAAKAGASDATVVRTARSLGFESLSALREVLLAELTGASAPEKRLGRTLTETAGSPAGALAHVLGMHEETLAVLKRDDVAEAFGRAIELLAAAATRHVFGIGPSGAIAEYASLQFNRVGLPTRAMSTSGIGLADHLLCLQPGDAVLMMAYAPLYREVILVLAEAARLGVPVVLISDSLGPFVAGQVAEILPVPRGRADHLAMHGGTLVLIEAMIVGLAGRGRDKALNSLERLGRLRADIDKDWSKRGIRKRGRPPAK